MLDVHRTGPYTPAPRAQVVARVAHDGQVVLLYRAEYVEVRADSQALRVVWTVASEQGRVLHVLPEVPLGELDVLTARVQQWITLGMPDELPAAVPAAVPDEWPEESMSPRARSARRA